MDAFIYALRDPAEPDRIAYIGQTILPAARYKQHMVSSRNASAGSRALRDWVEYLKACGRRPQMDILETVPAHDSGRSEALWIGMALVLGHNLLNGFSSVEAAMNLGRLALEERPNGL